MKIILTILAVFILSCHPDCPEHCLAVSTKQNTMFKLYEPQKPGYYYYLSLRSEAQGVVTQKLPSWNTITMPGKIDCHKHTIEYWKSNYKLIGQKENYTPEQIEEYGKYIEAIALLQDVMKPVKLNVEQ